MVVAGGAARPLLPATIHPAGNPTSSHINKGIFYLFNRSVRVRVIRIKDVVRGEGGGGWAGQVTGMVVVTSQWSGAGCCEGG